MTENKPEPQSGISRRGFLELASSALTLAVLGFTEPRSADAEFGDTVLPPFVGITQENLERARKRAAAIVARMTLDEKVSQFKAQAPAIPRLQLAAFNHYASEALHGLIHGGPVTSFPVPLALGCSWNRSLVQRVFNVVSDEIWAWHKKDGGGLAMFSPPTVNMGARDPRWGRIAENYSEDPYLVGQMAIYTVWGMQGSDARYLKSIACAKHFIANDTENDRESTSATVDPRSFWEYYTRGFEAAVKKGHVFTVMSSYNAMNGWPTTGNRALLTDILQKWGFQGYVVSDCDAVGDISRTHHFVSTLAEASALAVTAGCAINCGDTLSENLREAVDQMFITESTLDGLLVRSFTGRVLLGTFDPPEDDPYSKIPVSCLESPAHLDLAREAARQSIVLFKNDNRTLPLDKSQLRKIAIIGPMADVCNLGNYSGTPWSRISPLQGIRDFLGISTGPSYQKRASEFVQAGTLSKGGPFGEAFRGPGLEGCDEGGQAVSFISDNSWVAYDGVVFTGANEFHARVASGSAEGRIEVHVDSLDGPMVAQLKVSKTGGGQNWTNVNAPLKSVTGEHRTYLRFFGGPVNLFSTFNIQSFHLTPESQLPAPEQGPIELVYAEGCAVAGKKDQLQFDTAVQAAKEAEIALVFVGDDQQIDGEAHDRDVISLPGVQHELVQAVFAANPRTVLVVSSNAPVAINWEQDHLPAIIGGLFLGQEQGNALADALFGSYNPGGKLSTTWYRRAEDLPDFHDYNIRHGRTYMYFQSRVLYPFGHGLSYTTFQYQNLRISDRTLTPQSKISVSFEVTNSGSRDGDEIVQFYVHFAGGKVERPVKQLVNFDRVHIRAGETKSFRFELEHDDRALQFWDEDKYAFGVESGSVELLVGASSADIRLRDSVSYGV